MPTKREELSAALKEAAKAKDQVALSTIRLILAALKDRDIAARGQGKADGVPDADILSLLQSMIKQRLESAKIYRDAARPELAQREEQEIVIVERFLPKQLGEQEVQKIIKDLIAETKASDIKDMGKVMAELKTRYAGQMDMAKASGAVKTALAG